MFIKIMKWASVTALLLEMVLSSTAGYRIALEVLVCVAAIVVAAQAVSRSMYLWGVGFAAIAVLFNPAIPLGFSGRVFFWLDLVCAAAFLISLAILKSRPILSIPSITDRTPGSESL